MVPPALRRAGTATARPTIPRSAPSSGQPTRKARELRTRGAGSVEIKKRGADINPDDLRKSLKLGGGDEQLTVIATRVDGRHRAIICRRLAKNL